MIKYYHRLINELNPWQIALLAAIVYGAWAGWVNSEYGNNIALKASLVQASYAFFLTALVSLVARQLLNYFNFSRAARWIALLASWLVMLAIPVILHTWQHTPDLLEAILPGATIGSVYLWTYCHNAK
jgi:hypothetical protein